jgi:hypothetical protein
MAPSPRSVAAVINFNLICAHCGSDYAIEVSAPRPESLVTCGVCGHEGTFADWAASTERELSAQTDARIHDLARGKR